MLRSSRACRVRLVVVAIAVVLAASPAFGGTPSDRLREFFVRVNAILTDPTTEDRTLERVARVRRLVADVADVPGAAALALGAEWERRTPAERDEFVALFAEVLERAYVGRLAGAVRTAGSFAVSYESEVRVGEEVRVTTLVRGPGTNDLRVEYRMTARGGRWRVRDVVIDGVSTVENYRAQFTRVLQRDSYAKLVGQLREKLEAEGLIFAGSTRRAPPATASMAPPAPTPPPSVEHTVTVPSSPASVDPKTVAAVRAISEERPSESRRVAPTTARAQRETLPTNLVEPVSRPAPPLAVAVSRATEMPPPAPVAATVPVVAAAASSEHGAFGTVLGALLLGLVGVGAAALWRRRVAATR